MKLLFRNAMAAIPIKIVSPPATEIRRVVGEWTGDRNGPTLIVVGSIHGNEPSGRLALARASEFVDRKAGELKGRVLFLTGNVRASTLGVRFVDTDLNRHWTRENILRNSAASAESHASEDQEQSELLQSIGESLRTAVDEIFVLDLHSTSAGGAPFATVGDTMRNRRFAMKFPVTLLLGIEEQLEGTLLEFLNNEGAVTLGFEAGQHDDPASADNHEALVMLALVYSGVLEKADLPDFEVLAKRLRSAMPRHQIIEVRHREAITAGQGFEMRPGFANFDPVRKGQILASDLSGDIASPETGIIMMPLYQKKGEDGFFIARKVAPFWLHLSALLRRFDAARLMHLLPGVSEVPGHPEQLRVDTRIARFFPLQIFHLLGFRRLRWSNEFLLVSRRRFDTVSPFAAKGH
ncbi:MAG: succinylglutamate desuccinylase/aspartoacylase family protein [Chloracidobacterium sp.]|nr:succinylglutamate desuccinylase/aspartoacylase family protein [Chloracidobacterium sp.]